MTSIIERIWCWALHRTFWMRTVYGNCCTWCGRTWGERVTPTSPVEWQDWED
jgi:hypothetical protein